ncbi:MAG: glutathione peroxidase [Paludibacter sp.]
MKQSILLICITLILLQPTKGQGNKSTANFYQFKAKSLQGKEISMKSYEGKVVLMVNTASKSGFTPQYKGLEAIYEKFKDKGLVILGFPCNQFGKQEPGTETEIGEFCSKNYGVTFQLFSKIEVNGENADPLYKFLKTALPGTLGNDIKWNFTKFLLDKKGNPIKRFGSITKPEEISEDIEKLLSEK